MGVMLGESMASRVLAVVRRDEMRPLGRPGRPMPPRSSGVGGRWYRTTTSFAAATDDGTTLTLKGGQAKPQKRTSLSSGSATYVDAGRAAETLYNGLNGTIDAGKVVKIIVVDGLKVINLVWCG